MTDYRHNPSQNDGVDLHPLQTVLGILILLGLTILQAVCPPPAFDAGMQWGGHFKTSGDLIWPQSGTLLHSGTEPPLTDGVLDFRLNNLTPLPLKTELEISYEAVGRAGDFIRQVKEIAAIAPNALYFSTIADPDNLDRRNLMDLTSTITQGNDYEIYQRLDRLNLTYLPQWGFLRVGRQAVTWGDGFIFNPMDLFNPFSPTDIERDYKVGTDMLFGQYLLSPSGDLQGLIVPRRNPLTGEVESDESSAAVKMHFNPASIEWDLMAAIHYQNIIGGLGASGYAGGAVWRVNATWTVLEEDHTGSDGYLSVVANLDYSWNWWQRNWYGFIEWYYNGIGDDDYAQALSDPLIVERIERGELFVLGKSYVAGQLQVEVHPLVNLFGNAIVNTADPSAMFQIWGQWDAFQNLRVILGVELAAGADGTEYGGFYWPAAGYRFAPSNSLYARITLFF